MELDWAQPGGSSLRVLGFSDMVAGTGVIEGFFTHRSGFWVRKTLIAGVEPAGVL